MSLIPDEHREELRQELKEKILKPVKIIVFTQEVECTFCAQTRQLIQELAALNDNIKVEVYDFLANADKAKEYSVDKIPAVAIVGERDYGIRFYGLPYGYEFQTLIEDVIMVSKGSTDVSENVREKLKQIKAPVHIKVFVTLTCPYCPITALTAHKFAMENELIKADTIEAGEFPELALKYNIMTIPKVVINDKIEFVGAVPEETFLEQVLLASQQT